MPAPLPYSPLLSSALGGAGTHAHCRGCKERICVSTPVAIAGWHTVHACSPEHVIEVNVREPGAEPWAWRYAADAVAASQAQVPPTKRRPGTRNP
jgi:hypothetical protein